MAYQTRLDQLESEVFDTGKTLSLPNTKFILPYLVISVSLLAGLYVFSPSIIKTTPPKTKTNQKPVAQLQLQRFLLAWIVLCLLLCMLYYKYSDKISKLVQ